MGVSYRGSTFWPILYAVRSLRYNRVRNTGIILILAIGVALPTTVSIWTATGIQITVEEYMIEKTYMMRMYPQYSEMHIDPRTEIELHMGYGNGFDSQAINPMIDEISERPYIEAVHKIVSCIGILTGGTIPEWESYSPFALNYARGIKDCRTIIVTNEILNTWKPEFSWRGNFSLSVGEILVSEDFIDYAEQVHDIDIELDSIISIDLLRKHLRDTRPGATDSPDVLARLRIHNLTVVGIYDYNDFDTPLGNSFRTINRVNFDPFDIYGDPIFDLDDSVMISQEQIGKDTADSIATQSQFPFTILIRTALPKLLASGAGNVDEILLSLKFHIEEKYPDYIATVIEEYMELDSLINTYYQSRLLTILVLPVTLMSLFLTFFTSEISVLRKSGDIRSLRSKGASFNQVLSIFIWESLLLGIAGLIVGIVIALFMAPLVGSTYGFLFFDTTIYYQYLNHLILPSLAIVIATVIAMSLPLAYLIHIARRIDVFEIGAPGVEHIENVGESEVIWQYVLGLGAVLSLLLVIPLFLSPTASTAAGEILLATLILFIAAYLGSRIMRIIISRISAGSSFLIGEKSHYLSQSLRMRKSQFLPLLMILTLTLTTTTMMLVQVSSFEATLDNELRFSIGADMRIECDEIPLSMTQTLHHYPGIVKVCPVTSTRAEIGDHIFYLKGINPLNYFKVGIFDSSCFVNATAETVMESLAAITNGIIISEYYATLWNKTLGSELSIQLSDESNTWIGLFEVTGIMISAPGFGHASTHEISTMSFASQFGFQVPLGGFALTNLNHLSSTYGINTTHLILVDTTPDFDLQLMGPDIENEFDAHIYTPETFDLELDSKAIHLYLSGFRGLTTVAFLFCTIMGLSAIVLFLGSTVLERKSEYAIMRAVGGTRWQIVVVVFSEFASSVISTAGISLILGITFGYTMNLLVLGIVPFSPILRAVLAIPFTTLAIILSLEAIAMVLSCYYPARKAGSINLSKLLRNL